MLSTFCLRVKRLSLKRKSTYPQGYFPTTMSVGMELEWRWKEEVAFKWYVTYPSLVSKFNI
jgi:hypothetical protein